MEETQGEETNKTPSPPTGDQYEVSFKRETSQTSQTSQTERLISKINQATGQKLEAKDFGRFFRTRVNRWGFSVEDLEAVVNHKAKEWRGTDLERNLRPTVLFKTRARTGEYLAVALAELSAETRVASARPKGLASSHRLFTRKELQMPTVTPQDRENAKGHLVKLRAALAR